MGFDIKKKQELKKKQYKPYCAGRFTCSIPGKCFFDISEKISQKPVVRSRR